MTPCSPASTKGCTSPSHRRVTDEQLGAKIQQFLDDWHYNIMTSSMGKTWNRGRAMKAALQVLNINGLPLTPDDMDDLMAMEERLMVLNLVERMSEGLREDFELLAAQLMSLIAVTAQIRTAADSGKHHLIEDTMTQHETTVVGQQVLKNAVLHTSSEVAQLHRCQETWIGNMEQRLDRLQRAAEIAEQTNKKLIVVEGQLASFADEQTKKARQVLVGFAANSTKALLNMTWNGWTAFMEKEKSERGIREKYEKQLADLEDELNRYKMKQIENVRNAMMRGSEHEAEMLVRTTFSEWAKETQAVKAAKEAEAQMASLNSQLDRLNEEQIANAKRVMAKMGAGSDEMLLQMCCGAWVKWSQNNKKEKEFEEAAKAQAEKVAEALKNKKAEAMSVLDRMSASTDTGLKEMAFSNWRSYAIEGKKVRELEEAVNSAGAKFQSLKMNQKATASGVQGRINEQMSNIILLKIVSSWSMEAKVNRVDKYYNAKIDNKRKQLASVQTLFKSFANDLERGLQDVDGDSSGRGTRRRSQAMAGMMRDNSGAVSLPNIHGR
eukprot:TRINITY_DN94531_c0_g1_i1.p1 TRINITY_DN94531_c0_g1~~TRINITY_DN94531_c0_g1_i1.p1  ORF type:complete len:551 (-),score=161.55 TRINITY_DN94531_c0_g1_i1:129-1781(-)